MKFIVDSFILPPFYQLELFFSNNASEDDQKMLLVTLVLVKDRILFGLISSVIHSRGGHHSDVDGFFR
jgi:hypothetical protein